MLNLPAQHDHISRAHAHDRSCALCEHRCRANRLAGERGPCKAGVVPRVFKHAVEYGEELELVPSHLFYLSGCDLRCVFCIAELNAFDPGRGQELTAEFFNSAVEAGVLQGARTLQWVGGEPTIHLPALLDVMSSCPRLPPVVWKSDFHGTPEAISLLDGVVSVYLADFKFGNDACAKSLCGVDGYVRILARNLKLAQRQGRLIVRHLLLPGHFDCCYREIVGWLAANLPGVPLSIREGYLPRWRASEFVSLGVPLTAGEGRRAADLARSFGLEVIQ